MALSPALARPPEPDRVLFERWARDRDAAAREALVQRYLPLAQRLVSRYRAGNERDDLEQVAAIGLIKALDRYDPARGIAFASLAVPTILGELKRYFRDHGWAVRVPRHVQELGQRARAATEELSARLGRAPTAAEVAARCGSTPERVLEARAAMHAHFAVSLSRPRDADDDEPAGHAAELACEERGFADVDAAFDLAALLDRLPERERRILRLRFEAELSQREIADHCGLSQMHVCRLLARCLSELAPAVQSGAFAAPSARSAASSCSGLVSSAAKLRRCRR
jgi:RNA polymerase sigma-B factor